MKTLKVSGEVISDDDSWIYDFLGIDYVNPKMIQTGLDDANGEPVQVEINSGGGNVWSGSEIYTMLRKYPGAVTTQVAGLAASAASLIAMAGDVVEISPAGMLMIHKAATVANGNSNDLEDAQKMLDSVDSTLANAYTQKTGIPHDEVLALMDSTYWISPDDAIEKGFADKVMFDDSKEPLPAVASFGGIRNIEKLRNLLKGSTVDDNSKQLAFSNAEFEYLQLGGKQYV